MAISQARGAQYPVVAKTSWTYSDAALANAEVHAVVPVPAGATVIGGGVNVITAYDGHTAATIDVGDAGDPNRYSSSAVNVKAAGNTELTLTGYSYTEADTIDITANITASTAPTQGEVEVYVIYVVDDRQHENAS